MAASSSSTRPLDVGFLGGGGSGHGRGHALDTSDGWRQLLQRQQLKGEALQQLPEDLPVLLRPGFEDLGHRLAPLLPHPLQGVDAGFGHLEEDRPAVDRVLGADDEAQVLQLAHLAADGRDRHPEPGGNVRQAATATLALQRQDLVQQRVGGTLQRQPAPGRDEVVEAHQAGLARQHGERTRDQFHAHIVRRQHFQGIY